MIGCAIFMSRSTVPAFLKTVTLQKETKEIGLDRSKQRYQSSVGIGGACHRPLARAGLSIDPSNFSNRISG